MTRLVRHSLTPLLVGAPFAVLGCGGSGKPVVAPDAAVNNPSVRVDTGVVTVDATADAPAEPQGQTGKLVYRVMMTAPAGVTEAFTADEVALVQTQGIAIQGDTFVFPDVPASGEWVEVGGTRYMADATGVFEVPAGAPSSGTVGVYRQYTDTDPFVSFDLAGSLVAVGQTPVPIPLVVNAAFPMGMDCDGMGSCSDAGMNCDAMGSCPDASSPTGMNCDAGSCAHGLPLPWPGCPQRDISDCASNDGPCCLDFNGPVGDGFAYVRSGPGINLVCSYQSVKNWLSSTCFNWSFGVGGGTDTSCLNEAAYHPTSGNAPSCWANHKGRNCQELDLNALSVQTPAGTFTSVGESLQLVVSNNTPGNESVLTLTSDAGPLGSLSGDGLDGSVLRHYDNAAGEHYVERPITFTAPSDLQGRNSVSNTLQVQSHGKTVSVTITISQPKETQNDGSSDAAQPTSQLSVSFYGVTTYGQTRVETTTVFNTNFCYYSYPTAPQRPGSPGYDFTQCTSDQVCQLVAGRSTESLLTFTSLPINVVTGHTDTYTQDSSGQWQLYASTDTQFPTVTCGYIMMSIWVEPGSTAENYQYRFTLNNMTGGLGCPNNAGGVPDFGESLTMAGDDTEESDLSCMTPPRLAPDEIEPWVENPQGPKTWTLKGSGNCQDSNSTRTEDATVTLTLVPCNGGPCVP